MRPTTSSSIPLALHHFSEEDAIQLLRRCRGTLPKICPRNRTYGAGFPSQGRRLSFDCADFSRTDGYDARLSALRAFSSLIG